MVSREHGAAHTRSRRIVKVQSPLALSLGVKKVRKYILNLNQYRNWNHFTKNNLKSLYNEAMAYKLKGMKLNPPISIEYTLHRKDKRKGDRMNVLSVHDKFFCDALQKYGVIEDDTDDIIINHKFSTGEIDRKNPRVDILIKEE